MPRALRGRMTYANVMATIAVFIALGGTSLAATALITGKNVKDSSLTGRDIRDGSVTGTDVRDHSLAAVDFAAGQLPAGPAPIAGAQGAAGPVGAAGPAGSVGAQGAVGPVGVTGAAGIAGAEGVAGPAGATGADGATGPAGPSFGELAPTQGTTSFPGCTLGTLMETDVTLDAPSRIEVYGSAAFDRGSTALRSGLLRIELRKASDLSLVGSTRTAISTTESTTSIARAFVAAGGVLGVGSPPSSSAATLVAPVGAYKLQLVGSSSDTSCAGTVQWWYPTMSYVVLG